MPCASNWPLFYARAGKTDGHFRRSDEAEEAEKGVTQAGREFLRRVETEREREVSEELREFTDTDKGSKN